MSNTDSTPPGDMLATALDRPEANRDLLALSGVWLKAFRRHGLRYEEVDREGMKGVKKKVVYRGRQRVGDVDADSQVAVTADAVTLAINGDKSNVVRYEKGDVIDAVDLIAHAHGYDPAGLVAETRRQVRARERDRLTDAEYDKQRSREAAKERRETEKAAARAAEDGVEPGQSWAFSSDRVEKMKAVASGEYERARPTVCLRVDGAGLFYPGKTNVVMAEPGTGKSWLTFVAAMQEVNAGRDVLVIDYEGQEVDAYDRMTRDLGVDPADLAEHFYYLSPSEHPKPDDPTAPNPYVADIHAKFLAAVDAKPWSLVVIDGVTNSFAVGLFDTNGNDDANVWNREIPALIARRTGAAVVMVDHVAKTGGAGRYAVGAQSKLANVDGVQYFMDVDDDQNIRPDQIGRVNVYERKDKPGQVIINTVSDTRGRLYAQLQTTPNAETPSGVKGLRALLVPPEAAKNESGRRHHEKADQAVANSDAPGDIVIRSASGVSLPDVVAAALMAKAGYLDDADTFDLKKGVKKTDVVDALEVHAPAWADKTTKKRITEALTRSRFERVGAGEKYRVAADKKGTRDQPDAVVALAEQLRAVFEGETVPDLHE